MRSVQAQPALLDDQAAVFDVEQARCLGDVAGLGGRDAELQPQRARAGRDGLPRDVGRGRRRPEHVDETHLLGDVREGRIHRFAQDLGRGRVDRDDPPAVRLHVLGHIVGGLVPGVAGTDER